MKILVRQGQDWRPLNAHVYEGEQDLQRLLHSAPGILSATQFGGPEFIVAAREFGLPGSGATDLVAVAADGSILVAECKLARNDEIKRKVIGQIFEYAAFLWKRPYAEFDATFQRLLGAPLADLVRQRLDEAAASEKAVEWNDESFRERVQENLDSGNFVLAIVVDDLNEELSRTIAYLNERGRGNNFLLYALQLLTFKDAGTEVMIPQLHGASVKAVADNKKAVAETPRRQVVDKFLRAVFDGFRQRHPDCPNAHYFATGWFGFMAGYMTSRFYWSFAQGDRLRVGLYLDGGDPATVQAAYNELLSRKASIDEAAGLDLEWDPPTEDRRSARIAAYRPGNVFDQPELFEDLRTWAIDAMGRVVRALRPELSRLKA